MTAFDGTALRGRFLVVGLLSLGPSGAFIGLASRVHFSIAGFAALCWASLMLLLVLGRHGRVFSPWFLVVMAPLLFPYCTWV